MSESSKELLGITSFDDFEGIVREEEETGPHLSSTVQKRSVYSPDETPDSEFRVLTTQEEERLARFLGGSEGVPLFSADGEVVDEPGEVLEIVEKDTGVPASSLPSGVWLLSTFEKGCRAFALTGKPINPDLEGVLVKDITPKDGVVYKAFSADGARILGEGGNGIALLVTDRTYPDESTWEQVVVKIEAKQRVDPDLEGEAHGPIMKEVTIGMLLDRIFYKGRVTPSVTRTLAVFQCPQLPPPVGTWKDLTELIWPHGENDVRDRVASDPDMEYLYTEQEFANAGTINDMITPGKESLVTQYFALAYSPGDLKLFVKSFVLQGLYTLEAFRRAGFIHGDLNDKNVALEEIPQGPDKRRIYFTNSKGLQGEMIFAFDPFSGKDDYTPFRVKFIDYGWSMFAFRDPRHTPYRENMHARAMPGRMIFPPTTAGLALPPESFLREPTGKFPGDLDTRWWASTASDLWQFALIVVAVAFGRNPLVNAAGDNYRFTPPKEFITLLGEHIRKYPKNYEQLDRHNLLEFVPWQMWNIAMMIGFPGVSYQSGKINPAKRIGIEKRYPILKVFNRIDKSGIKSGGWLRTSKTLRGMFGPYMTQIIWAMLYWDPNKRPRPGEIISNPETIPYFKELNYYAESPTVSIGVHNRYMEKTKDGGTFENTIEAWSLVTSDISYHVPISRPMRGHGPSQFTKLPKELAECVEAGFLNEEAPRKKEEGGGESWSRWMF